MSRTLLLLAFLAALAMPSPILAQWDYCTDGIEFELFPGGFTLHHLSTQFNCCPVLVTEVFQGQHSVDIVEKDIGQNPCMCLCCYDFTTTVTGLDAGVHAVTLWKWAVGDELVGAWEIDVVGESPPAVLTSISDCGGTSVESLSGWGTLKALYR